MVGVLLVTLGLHIGGINMGKEAVEAGLRELLGRHDLLLHLLTNTLLGILDLLGSGKTGINHGLLHELQRITGGSGEGNLLTVAVRGTGIGHGVAVVTVGHHLDVHGPVASRSEFPDEFHTLLHGKDVHAVNADTGDVVAHLVVVRVRGVAVDGGTHTVLVVLNAEDHRQFPQTGHVGRLPDLSLVGGTVTVTGDGHVHGLTGLGVVLVGKGQPSSERNLCTDDAGTTPEVPGLVVEVHRSALGLGHAAREAEQLADDLLDGAAAGQGDAMASVRGDPIVGRVEGGVDAGGDGLLAVVQVAEAADVLGLVLVVARDLHPAHGVHELEVLHELLLGHFY